MPYKLSFTLDEQQLNCIAKGERSFGSSMQMWKSIIKEVKKHCVNTLLLEIFLTGRMSPNENLHFAQKITPLLKPLNLIIALVDHQPQSFHDNYVSGIIVNQQNVQVKVFENLKLAKQWLLQLSEI